MTNTIFDLCVQLLLVTAHALGMTYKAVNVWIFCVAWPIALCALFGIAVWQRGRIRELERAVGREGGPEGGAAA